MPNGEVLHTKEKIVSLLRMNGPSLPVHIAHGTGLSILFASAFLSELLYEGKIRISHLKVGNSPLYFVQGQEYRLERFAQYLKSREKDAFFLIRERKFLKDSEQEPAIRVALRELKDFAIPFKKDEEIYWRYFNVPKEELFIEETVREKPKEEIIPRQIIKEIPKEETKIIFQEKKKDMDIFEKEKPIKKMERGKVVKKTVKKKHDEKFFERIKEFLSKKNIDIIDIHDLTKEELILRVKENQKERLLIAYNKKRLTEADLLKAYKKAGEMDLPYIILSSGELPKKLKDLISAIKEISRIEKIE